MGNGLQKGQNSVRFCLTVCETKSHRILALLEPISHKIFKSHRIDSGLVGLMAETLNLQAGVVGNLFDWEGELLHGTDIVC